MPRVIAIPLQKIVESFTVALDRPQYVRVDIKVAFMEIGQDLI
jgi:hypothetical protein